jgi:signal transduction histidine kinase
MDTGILSRKDPITGDDWLSHLSAGPTEPGGVAYPLFLECDLRGHVLWMSERARAALGGTETLIDSIERVTQLPRHSSGGVVRFLRVTSIGGGVLLGLQPEERDGRPGDFAALARLQTILLEHYFLLQQAERRLSMRARHRRRGKAGATVRQLERERQRIGRELHTGVGQMLAAIRLQLEVVLSRLPDAPEAVTEALDRLSTLAESALEQVRAISRRLHPPEWQRLRLEAAIGQLWDISGIPQRFEGSLRIQELPRDPDPEIKALIYRSAQEALSNITSHSGATRVHMVLKARGSNVILSIEDNGVGFDAAGLFSAPATLGSGIGLRSIRDQAESAGAILELESRPGGTKLEVSAPFSPVES